MKGDESKDHKYFKDCTVKGCKISTDNSILPWFTVATTDHPGGLRNHNMASQEYPRYRKHQVAITAHDHWWSRRRTSGGTRKQTYSWCIVTNTQLTSSDRRGHHMSPQKHMYVARMWYYQQTKDTLTYTGVLHDKLSQDPLHGWEESKVRLKK